MAVETVDALTELASPATNDEIGIWDVSAGQFKKIQVANLIGATITGGGTIALGGYTLTVPATGTAALLATANTFTAVQIINTALDNALKIQESGTDRIAFLTANANKISIANHDNGSYGGHITLGANTASNKAAGMIEFLRLDGSTASYVWVDATGVLRIHTTPPSIASAATDTAGTVVGAQTSSLDSKTIIGAPIAIDDVLAAVQAGAAAVRRFVYKDGAINGEEFSGLVTDYAPRYGMDRDDEHPAGKSLNMITTIGDLLMAVANLSERLAALEAVK